MPQNDDLAGILRDETPRKARKSTEARRPQTAKYTPSAVNKSERSERSQYVQTPVEYSESIPLVPDMKTRNEQATEDMYNFIAKKVQTPAAVESGKSSTIAVKPKPSRMLTFYIYGGNYPDQLVNALLKRGVWKVFDK